MTAETRESAPEEERRVLQRLKEKREAESKLTTVDAFEERSRRGRSCLNSVCFAVQTTGLELAYDRQEETSLTTIAGIFASLAISTRFGVLIPQGTFEYVHEFEDDQRAIRFHFAEDLQRHRLFFNNDPPDRDISMRGPVSSWWSPADFRHS